MQDVAGVLTQNGKQNSGTLLAQADRGGAWMCLDVPLLIRANTISAHEITFCNGPGFLFDVT